MSDRPLSEHETADAVFAALAHPTRRKIMTVLRSAGGRMAAGEIARRFSFSWPTTTRHLHVLQSAGLVHVEPRGRERTYVLDAALLDCVVRKWLRWFEEGV